MSSWSEDAGDGPRSADRDAQRLKLTAIRDQLDSLIDEAGRRELTTREALSLFCEREIARKDERRIEMSVGLALPVRARSRWLRLCRPAVDPTRGRSARSPPGVSSPMPR